MKFLQRELLILDILGADTFFCLETLMPICAASVSSVSVSGSDLWGEW